MIVKNADWGTDLALGKKLYEANCVKCHRDHGQGNWKEDPPVVEGQPAPADDGKKGTRLLPGPGGPDLSLFGQAIFSWIQIGKRRNANPDMVKQIKEFSFLDMKSVTDYASRFKMQEGDWMPKGALIGEKDEEGGFGLGEEKEDEDMPAHLKE